MPENHLYYGDNLDVLRRYVKDESVDLIYLDPPFNSRQDYNVLFAEKDGSRSSSQIKAFEDTWEWNQEAERTYEELVEQGGQVADVMRAFRTFLKGSDMMAYLAMMAPRLIELRRVLKVTGSIYLHCDPTASHYLKMLMDAVFGPQFLRNEIIWKRTNARSTATQWPRVHDVLLFYSSTDYFRFHAQKTPADKWRLANCLMSCRHSLTMKLTDTAVERQWHKTPADSSTCRQENSSGTLGHPHCTYSVQGSVRETRRPPCN